ncbi:hypothetical protein NQ317_019352 [Molorchus minor]|uniref:RRM domain-containing protein n=1 Tax=Molorchus minor TaxID=1323400 RepID=A0ABQ9J9J3_9CUCU|nr:hypothetical protein NQ317_019352 [Molorchus minor]
MMLLAAYDKVLKGRKEAQLRHKELDGKRRKLKEDLEAREQQAAGKSRAQKSADQLLKEEIERLRKEGSKQVEEEVEYVRRRITTAIFKYRILGWIKTSNKIKWSASKNDATNGGYTQEMLHRFLSKYGDIQALIMSPKKKGSALVEFKDKKSTEMAVDLEVGLPVNPLTLEWIDGPPKSSRPTSSLIKESDFESVTLMKMRQAKKERG